MFLKIGVSIIIILLLKIIANQQELDCHMSEVSRGNKYDIKDLIIGRGIINIIVWIFKIIFADINCKLKCIMSKKKESK